MIANEKLDRFIGSQHIPYSDAMQLARELRDLRKKVARAYNAENIDNALRHLHEAYNKLLPDD